MERLERELLSRELRPARPVGLRYDRLEREGFLCGKRGAGSELGRALYWYSLCNCLLISRLLVGCGKVAVTCGEGWSREFSGLEENEVTRICLASSGSPEENSGPEESLVDRRETRSRVESDGSVLPEKTCGKLAVETYEKLPLKDCSFDGLVADSSILLTRDLAACLRELKRILKPGSTVFFLVANWEYEMAGKGVVYETSFKRYGGNVYLGFVKRTFSPPEEVEYICLLDPRESLPRKLARMRRDELRTLTIADVPEAGENILSVEVINIHQVTAVSLKHACEEAGFRSVIVAGAPGILATRFTAGLSSMLRDTPARPAGTPLLLSDDSSALTEEICRALAYGFPFISPSDSPHIVGIGVS